MFLSQVRRRLILLVAILSVLLVPVAVFAAPVPQPPLCFTVPGITNCISGRFLQYWTQNGGLPVFGYPISAAALERTAEGVFPTQYFERARFEYHPDKTAPYDVLLGRLGDERLKQFGRDWSTFAKGKPTTGCLFFAQTGHSVCNQAAGIGFLSYWQSHGLQDPSLNAYQRSLALFGLPLSEPQIETNSSGDTVLTQWFERARFEYHPNNPRAFKVLLGLLGVETNPAPTRGVVAAAWVIDPAPRPYNTALAFGKLTLNGLGIARAPMVMAFHYKTATWYCEQITGPDGVAACPRYSPDAIAGYTVLVDVYFTYNGNTYHARTSFTPRWATS
jgi:hypothetical protein